MKRILGALMLAGGLTVAALLATSGGATADNGVCYTRCGTTTDQPTPNTVLTTVPASTPANHSVQVLGVTLAATGADVAGLSAIAVVLVGAGVVLVTVSRRRRASQV